MQESAILEVVAQMQAATADLARLMNYISLNLAAVRKCLKKYAKNVELSPALPGEMLALPLCHFANLCWGPDSNGLGGVFDGQTSAQGLTNLKRYGRRPEIQSVNSVKGMGWGWGVLELDNISLGGLRNFAK